MESPVHEQLRHHRRAVDATADDGRRDEARAGNRRTVPDSRRPPYGRNDSPAMEAIERGSNDGYAAVTLTDPRIHRTERYRQSRVRVVSNTSSSSDESDIETLLLSPLDDVDGSNCVGGISSDDDSVLPTTTAKTKKKRTSVRIRRNSTSLPSRSFAAESDDAPTDKHDDEDEDELVDFAKNNLITEHDVAAYMAGREMTPSQERMNAVTVVPNAVYCLYFLLSGAWQFRNGAFPETAADLQHSVSLVDATGCLHSSWFPHLYALPPLPLVAVVFGVVIHTPFSFIYHWTYAHRLPPGFARTNHWSRRMDQAMIHAMSASMAYATSGRLDFFLVNLFFNIDCMYRQFQKRVRPRANKIRIGISILAYTLPVLRRGDVLLFCKLWAVYLIGGWLFVKYPIGGWSHAAFHIVGALLPPMLMNVSLSLPVSQEQTQVAARCYAMRG